VAGRFLHLPRATLPEETPVPDVHLPHLDDENDDTTRDDQSETANQARRVVPSPGRRSKSLLKIVLEVGLISIGVFLGLAGEQWRERAHHHELAQASLRRFRSELQANRAAVASVRDKHVRKQKDLQTYFAAHSKELANYLADPRAPLPLPIPDSATDPPFFEYSAWDIALATQSLAYIDPDLAASISHAYRVQLAIDELTSAITRTMYSFSNEVAFLSGVMTYFGDCALHEARLLSIYDELLPKLDRALDD
jgi:hypothetical protein